MEFEWIFSREKSLKLKEERELSFEEVIGLIEAGEVLDVLDHPNQKKYPGQQIYVVNVEGYAYLVPFFRKGNAIELKTIYPSRRATKIYMKP